MPAGCWSPTEPPRRQLSLHILSAIERQTRRLSILGTLCRLADFRIDKRLYRREILGSLPKLSAEIANSELLYLHKKGFIECTTTHSIGTSVQCLKLTVRSIDLIEKMETGQDSSEFEEYFSKPSIDIYIGNNRPMYRDVFCR